MKRTYIQPFTRVKNVWFEHNMLTSLEVGAGSEATGFDEEIDDTSNWR